MSADKNYEQVLEDICKKLKDMDSIKEIDILDIKNVVESIENTLTDTQLPLNFDEIKEKLENIAFQVDSCNETLLKDLYNDIRDLKETFNNVGQHLENLQNVQNLALTSAEFEEFQKQQLDLAVKTNDNIYSELKVIKETSQIDYTESIKKLDSQIVSIHTALTGYLEQFATKIQEVPVLEDIASIVSDLNSVQEKNIKQTSTLVKEVSDKLTAFTGDFKYKEIEAHLQKITEIYDNLNFVHAWIDKVGDVNKSIDNVYARLGETIDFDDVAGKVDIIYENISLLNTWTKKIENIDSTLIDTKDKIFALGQYLEDAKNINKIIVSIKDKVDSTFSEEIDFDDISNKMDIVYENITSLNMWAQKVDVMTEQVSNISASFEEDMIASKIDLIYENIGLLNEWVNKIDNLTNSNNTIDLKIEEVNQKIEKLNQELGSVIHSTKDDADSYIYTLLDIESDFLKLHKFVDDKSIETSQSIDALKARFNELNDDISSISIRTNKLILTADDANKEFKTHLDSFKAAILDFNLQKQGLGNEAKLDEKLNEMFKLMQNSLTASRNLNNAFSYFAEWIDATGTILNTMNANINALMEKSAGGSDDDIAEIKSLLTGIMVQLNTAVTPDIDSINERIDNVSDEHNGKFTELETMLQEKVNQQAKQIASLEDKIDNLTSKFDKLIDAMSEEQNNFEIKDILNYIATQTATTQETITSQIAEKLSSFDTNINKIVSYIEEE